MAEKLFQFLLKLKEDGVDLSEVDVWFESNPFDPECEGYGSVTFIEFNDEANELILTGLD